MNQAPGDMNHAFRILKISFMSPVEDTTEMLDEVELKRCSSTDGNTRETI